MEITVNYLAVLAAAISAMVIGFIWYSPTLGFGRMWMRLMGWGMDMPRDKGAETRGMIFNFLAALIQAFVLAHFSYIWGAADVAGALELAFWLWLGFIATTFVGSVLWERRPLNLYFLNIGYHLVTLATMSLVIALWA